jgi:iron(III) transport system permease protein
MSFISAARKVSHVALLATGANLPLALLQLDFMVEGRYEAASVVGMIVVVMTIGVALLGRLAGLRLGIRS